MAQLLFLIVIALVFYLVAYPYFTEPGEMKRIFRRSKARRKIEYLNQEKDRTYEILTDLTYEHAGGKISDNDFQELKEDFMYEGTTILRRIDTLNKRIAENKAQKRRKRKLAKIGKNVPRKKEIRRRY